MECRYELRAVRQARDKPPWDLEADAFVVDGPAHALAGVEGEAPVDTAMLAAGLLAAEVLAAEVLAAEVLAAR